MSETAGEADGPTTSEPPVDAEQAGGHGRTRRLFTARRAVIALAGALMVCGALVLLVPYDTTVELEDAGTSILKTPEPINGRCEAPLLDAFHGESDGWLNYTSDTGTTESDQQSLTGVWCSPESLQRAGAGTALVVAGMGLLLAASYVRHRRIRRGRRDPSDAAMAPGLDAGSPPVTASGPAAPPDPGSAPDLDRTD